MITLRTAAIALLFLSCVPELSAQGPENAPIGQPAREIESPVSVDYDSLQDVRVDRIEQRIDRRIWQMEETQEGASYRIDSLEGMLDAMFRHIQRLERDNEVREKEIVRLTSEISRQEEAASLYRERYRRLFWWSTSLTLLLLMAGFVFLLVFSIHTRQLLTKKIRGIMEGTDMALITLKKKQKKFSEKLLARVKADNRALRSRIKSQRKAVRRTARKEVRAELKSSRR